jgi:hypothetical protein
LSEDNLLIGFQFRDEALFDPCIAMNVLSMGMFVANSTKGMQMDAAEIEKL